MLLLSLLLLLHGPDVIIDVVVVGVVVILPHMNGGRGGRASRVHQLIIIDVVSVVGRIVIVCINRSRLVPVVTHHRAGHRLVVVLLNGLLLPVQLVNFVSVAHWMGAVYVASTAASIGCLLLTAGGAASSHRRWRRKW